MTPLQRKQLTNILLKEGEENWTVERKHYHSPLWKPINLDDDVDTRYHTYRAVRRERVPIRTPLPIEHYKRGMEVCSKHSEGLVLGGISAEHVFVSRIAGADLNWAGVLRIHEVESWRWPNETEWHPAYTETVDEKIVETLTVEEL